MSDFQSCFKSLRKIVEIMQDLLSLSREKQQVLLKGNLESLNNLVAKEQAVAASAGHLEKLRQREFATFAHSLLLDDDFTLRGLALRCPREEAELLIGLGEELTDIVREIGEINIQNAGLISQSLELVELFVKSLAIEPELLGYHSDDEARNRLSLVLDKRV